MRKCRGQNASLLDAVRDGEAVQQGPIVLHLTLLTFMKLAEDGEDGEKLWGTARSRQDSLQSIVADGIKGLGQVYAFFLYLPQHVYGPSIGPEPTLTFGRVFLCFRRNESLQHDASQDFACIGEQGNALVV